jgi:diguanylate cyclase (GGDEF)-like protein
MAQMDDFVRQNPQAMYCVAIADIDFFKNVNDTYGHNCGDYVLQSLARLFMDRSGGRYSVGRWGGEEFFIVFDGCSFEDAHDLVEDLRVRFSETLFEKSGQHTMSIGITQVCLGESPDEACIRVDEALYEAKRQGKNRIVVV